ncbi:hypothetical protein Bbelb_137640 [Branchiostoma belcheri]|nr:hypothetical protein Bbelb_137640 [Branchiostoma belcheri]
MAITRYYQTPALNPGAHEVTCKKLQTILGSKKIGAVTTENCFNICVDDGKDLTAEEQKKLLWVITTPFEGEKTSRESFLGRDGEKGLLIEIGPRLNFSTAFSTNAVSICHAVGLKQISRIEVFRRFLIQSAGGSPPITAEEERRMLGALHDRMTECRYTEPVSSFELDVKPDPWYEVDVMGGGKEALMKANTELGLAFDDWDLEYYTKMFRDQLGRNPTSVECFDLAQSNSEHSRHWFFKGKMVIDGKEHEDSLFKMVMKTQEHSNDNNVIKFSDNSSAIQGYQVPVLQPGQTSVSSSFQDRSALRHVIFTAETHNFPTGVAPFPGATTGTGGRIRDVQAAGQGAHVVAGTAGYSFGNLCMQGYDLPWEDKTFEYPSNMASPVDICIEASNGASDYGNKFGEPVLAGFARSFGMRLADGERKEWVKPIMFSGGIGQLEGCHITKDQPTVGMEVVKLGGPVYRIGVGGGAASSVIAGENKEELDFGAVQRGDAEMEQKLNRVIRACIEMVEENPIRSIHDQGAGGNGNVLKEIVEPAGAVIRTSEFQLGDPTISVMELWGAEYQESNAVLVRSADAGTLRDICTREKCPVAFVGEVTGDGKIVLEESEADCPGEEKPAKRQRGGRRPVDLDLECVLGSMPRKTFNFDTIAPNLTPLSLPDGLGIREALERVLRLPSVASKRYLTNKVDRSVTGLVAQQQCVGPLHTPLADVAVTALSHFSTVGSATVIGEQPIKGLLDPAAGARMSVGEALTNLVFARVTDLKAQKKDKTKSSAHEGDSGSLSEDQTGRNGKRSGLFPNASQGKIPGRGKYTGVPAHVSGQEEEESGERKVPAPTAGGSEEKEKNSNLIPPFWERNAPSALAPGTSAAWERNAPLALAPGTSVKEGDGAELPPPRPKFPPDSEELGFPTVPKLETPFPPGFDAASFLQWISSSLGLPQASSSSRQPRDVDGAVASTSRAGVVGSGESIQVLKWKSVRRREKITFF